MKLNHKRMTEFLEALEKGAFVKDAATLIGMTWPALYKARKRDEDFARKWDDAVETARLIKLDAIEAEIKRRSVDGVDEPVFHKGVNVATIKKFSDPLLMFWAKSLDPEKYRENIKTQNEHSGPNGQPLTMSVEVTTHYVRPKPEEGDG